MERETFRQKKEGVVGKRVTKTRRVGEKAENWQLDGEEA